MSVRARGSDYTVVIPVWGDYYCRRLPQAVASVRRQAPDAPLTVIDNASDSALPELIDVDVVRLPERVTVGVARNSGLARVSTPFVLFADADDLVLEGALENLAETLRRDSKTVAAVGGVIEDGARPHRSPRPIARALATLPPMLAVAQASWSVFPICGCAMMRTEVALEIGGFGDTESGSDWELSVALATTGRIRFTRQPVRDYRNPGKGLGLPPSSRELRLRARNARRQLGLRWWGRALRPAVAGAQLVAIHILRPIVRVIRHRTGYPHG